MTNPPSAAMPPDNRAATRTAKSNTRRELLHIVNAERFLNTAYLLHHPLESFFSEELVFSLFEIFTQRRVFVLRHELAECGEKNRIFARLVRRVHAHELMQRGRERLFIGVGLQARTRERQNPFSDSSPGLVLGVERIDEIDELVLLSESRKEMILFELLVVLLDERSNDVCRICDCFRRKARLRCDPAANFVIDEQDTFEKAVLAHQVFGGSDLFLLLSSRELRHGDEKTSGGDQRHEAASKHGYSSGEDTPYP